MAARADMKEWVIRALHAMEEGCAAGGMMDGASREGKASTRGVTAAALCEHLWRNRESELRASGNLFYRWQVEVRRALANLNQAGIVRRPPGAPPGVWALKR